MKRSLLFIALCGLISTPSWTQDSTMTRARQLEASGNSAGALQALADAAARSGASENDLAAYAHALDQYGGTGARDAYAKFAARSTSPLQRQSALRRLVLLSLAAGDSPAATRQLEQYRAAGGNALPAAMPAWGKMPDVPTIDIPGPRQGFSRMAALSPDLKPEDMLPALARNIVTNGYQASNSQESLEQTEYLKLVFRYISQARELEKLAGPTKELRIETCESKATGELLRIIGYRMRGACGGELVLETVNASRAFLTIDSGFPLAELEQALRTNRPFSADYSPTKVPALYGPEYWLSSNEKKQTGEFLDTFLGDPALCRLYLGLSKLDRETADELRKAVPAQRLRAFAHVLDFFGGMFLIRDGKLQIPGGARSAAAWADLAGASPDQGGAFLEKLLTKDDGWLSSYFDSLSRIEGPVLTYLTEPTRLKRFYNALRGRVTSPGPARPVFRSNTDLMLLTTRMRVDPDGQVHIPGGIEVWKELFIKHPHGKYDGNLTKLATTWKSADDIVEALFALCRKAVENEPLKIYMAMSDLNNHRAKPLDPATVNTMARLYRTMSSQYPLFSEVHTLTDTTILKYLDAAQAISSIRDQGLRADAAGSMQALTGLWQIFVRNRIIPPDQAESTLTGILTGIQTGFTKSGGGQVVFDVSVAGVKTLLNAAGSTAGSSVQDRMLDLLAGSTQPSDPQSHQHLVQEMVRIFEAQKLVSLKTLLDIADHLDAVAKGEKINPALFSRLAARMSEIQLPRASLTGIEKNALSFGYWTEKHIDQQRKMNLRNISDPGRAASIKDDLALTLRDTLVGFNYLYYAPPGAQLLRTNPLFVRSHDFLGVQGTNQTWRNTEVLGSGWPSSAGGRLVGSLSGLAYALAESEQNFMIPSREQALIWGDLAPQMIISAKVPRWWNVSPSQVHYVGLHVRLGESLLAEAMLDPARRTSAVSVIGRQASPARASRVGELLAAGDYAKALENVTASELFLLAADQVRKSGSAGVLESEIQRLAQADPQRVSYAAISRAFGTPKPTLTTSYRPELLHLRTFPTLMGYSSRIMAESWESSILAYVALADEMLLPPGRLNVVIPEWTQNTVERIFATHLEDWPALLRSIRVVSDDVRSKANKSNAEKSAGAGF